MTHSSQQPVSSRRSGRIGLTLVVALVLLGGSAYGGYWWWSQQAASGGEENVILHTVDRRDFLLAVTERGEVQSAGVTEVRSEVKTKNQPGLAILKIVDEGMVVKEGDFLVELDSSAFQEERITQKIAVNTAEALVTEARNVYETAVIAKQEYLEGTFVQERQTIESEVFVAEENLNRAKEYYEYSKKLAAKGYVNKLQLEADKFAVAKSEKELEAAQTKLTVLEEFTKAKMLKQLESDIKIFEAKWEAEKSSLELATSQLRDIEEQIAKCTIIAPRDGTVVYAHESDRRGQEDFIVEEGAVIRERQTIIRLPDASSMQVEVKINESLVQYVKPGMPATITPVGLDDLTLSGTVKSVNRYAEPSGWRKANVKEYKAFVQIDEGIPELRSGMTASVNIRCDYVPDALQVPVQAVYAHGDKYYSLVYSGNNFEARPIICGSTNDRFFVVEDGLSETERVAMNPRKYLDRVQLPELPSVDKQRVARRGPVKPMAVKTQTAGTPANSEASGDASVTEKQSDTSAATTGGG